MVDTDNMNNGDPVKSRFYTRDVDKMNPRRRYNLAYKALMDKIQRRNPMIMGTDVRGVPGAEVMNGMRVMKNPEMGVSRDELQRYLNARGDFRMGALASILGVPFAAAKGLQKTVRDNSLDGQKPSFRDALRMLAENL
jgi:hypothetical protein